ncbi:MAG: nucleoside hydrolase [Oscillospiraceae bacterium]|nr:nucleoside hydrolase [Oscillospiraceae bacterium]
MEKTKVILDCDTGSDDAVAIMLAILSDKLELLGVSTVAGNKEINFTTDNTLRVIELLGSKAPVYRGCHTSMVTKIAPGRRGGYNGMTGVSEFNVDAKGNIIQYHNDCLPIAEAKTKEKKEHAVFWLIDTLMRSEGDIVLVPTGPLTNIAMALRLEPAIAGKIKELVFMGGGFKVFNSTSCAEFNIWADPEAAQIVLTSGIEKITMVPLDATHSANFSREDAKELRDYGTELCRVVADLIDERVTAYDAYQPQNPLGTAPLHDALALAYVFDREVLRDVKLMRVDVDCGGGFADGSTLCDTRAYPDRELNCYVALDADRERFVKLTKELLKSFK